MTAPDTPSMTPLETLSLKGAALACNVSESTIRRNREKLRKYGAKQTSNGWEIPRQALIMAGLLEAPETLPMTAPDRSNEIPSDSPHDSPQNSHIDTLRSELAEARSEAREWRARAEERDRERTQLINRAEAAEATAREATAAAAALALTMKQLEHRPAHEVVEEPLSEDFSQDESIQSQEEKTSPTPPVERPRGKLWKRAEKIFGSQR